MSAASVSASKAIGQATDAKILNALSHHPRGLTQVEIAKMTGFTKDRVNSALRRIGSGVVRGEVREDFRGMTVLSAMPEHEETMRQRVAEDVARRRQNAKMRKDAANERASAKRFNRPVFDDSWSESPPKRKIVPAHLCKPLGKVGPASVWELAA